MTQEDKIRKAMIALRQSYDLLASMLPKEVGAEMGESLESDLTVKKIHSAVVKVFGVDPLAKTQKEEIVLARHAYRFLLRFITQKTYKSIGLITGTVDHKSVIHSVETCKDLLALKWYATKMRDCKKLLANEIAEASERKELKFAV